METIILKSSDIVSNRPNDQTEQKPMKEAGLSENEARPYASAAELAEKTAGTSNCGSPGI